MMFMRDIVPGQKLVVDDLTKILKMSRTPIINALYQLEREGFTVSLPYRGFYVKPADIAETIELFEVREALESKSVQLAIKRQSEGDLEALTAAANNHAAYMPHLYDRKKIALGVEFHLQIAKIAKNKSLEKTLKLNMEHEYLRYIVDQANPNRMQPAVDEHFQLIEKIRARDSRGAVRLVTVHIQRSRDHILELLNREY
jgi:DNA-binding GntR family transcriptional regulator